MMLFVISNTKCNVENGVKSTENTHTKYQSADLCTYFYTKQTIYNKH